MRIATISELQISCPVKGGVYRSTLGAANSIEQKDASAFLTQWYAFSASVPDILCIAAEKASSEVERKNIVENLHSELGLDTDGPSHPELLSDLIEKATGSLPLSDAVSEGTIEFLTTLKKVMIDGNSALNAGVMLSLEIVAYEILSVLKEILHKSGNRELLNHLYITIHEEVEMEHIGHTEKNVMLHKDNMFDVVKGFSRMNALWVLFWNIAFSMLVPRHV